MKKIDDIIQEKLREDVIKLFQNIILNSDLDKIFIYDIVLEIIPTRVLNDNYGYESVDTGERKITLHYKEK